jgi:uncharacterized protein YbaP (TraB family)
MFVTRRNVSFSLAAAVGFPGAFAHESVRRTGPLLWVATKAKASVYLFPFGEAKDGSWFTDRVKDAFASSSELWLELGPPPPKDRVDALYENLGHDSARTLFEALTPPVRARALQYMSELGIPRDSVQTMRPWLAYYTYLAAFDKKYGHSEGFTNAARPQLPPDWVLGGQALKDHKPVHFELTLEDWLRKLAVMPDSVQSDYLDWLMDWFDDEKKGLNRDRFDWMEGHLVARPIERMRTQLPDLYEIMDGQRNRWWVRQIDELLSRGGTYFVAIGQDHFADSRGIPALLLEQGILKQDQLQHVSAMARHPRSATDLPVPDPLRAVP